MRNRYSASSSCHKRAFSFLFFLSFSFLSCPPSISSLFPSFPPFFPPPLLPSLLPYFISSFSLPSSILPFPNEPSSFPPFLPPSLLPLFLVLSYLPSSLSPRPSLNVTLPLICDIIQEASLETGKKCSRKGREKGEESPYPSAAIELPFDLV